MNARLLRVAHERGRPQSWGSLDVDLRDQIEGAVARTAAALSSFGFVGAYLHGSLSTGSFYRPKSDVDLLFVVEDALPADGRELVARSFVQLSEQLPLTGDYEVSILRREDTASFHQPLPYELHYSAAQRGKIQAGSVDFALQRADPDLAAHCMAVTKRGVALRGAPIPEVFGPVPVDAYRGSILDDFRWILDDDHLLETPFYGVLNCCRVLALDASGWDRVISKDEGGEWGCVHLPPEHRPIIAQALACYRSPAPVAESERKTDGHAWDTEALHELREYVRGRHGGLLMSRGRCR